MVLTDFPTPPDSQSPSMLITDDDRSWRETLREVFEPRGFKTLLAADGAEAWEIVRHESVHVVLLDMHMPKLTGLDLLRQLQRSELKLPCVLMSAAMDELLEREALSADAESVLPKPVSFRQITDVVSRIMRARYDWPS